MANLGIIGKGKYVAKGLVIQEPPLNNLEQYIAQFGFVSIIYKWEEKEEVLWSITPTPYPSPHPSPHHTDCNWTLTEIYRTWQDCLSLNLTDETTQQVKLQSDLNEIPEKFERDEGNEKNI